MVDVGKPEDERSGAEKSVPQPDVRAALLEAQDRRRPGRLESVSENLIPLLRKPLPEEGEAAALLAGDSDPVAGWDAMLAADGLLPDQNDELSAARGVLAGLVLSLPLWGGIFAVVYLIS